MASKHAVVIDTKLNNQKIKADFKELEKTTQSLINKYNKQVDSIKSQELAIEKVKQKIEEVSSIDKIPSSMKNLLSETKKTEKELDEVEKKLNDLEEKEGKINNDIKHNEKIIKFSDDIQNIRDAEGNLFWLKIDKNNITEQLDIVREKYDNLIMKIQDNKNAIKEASDETKNWTLNDLNKQLDLMNSKLIQSKEEIAQTGEQIQEAFDKRHTIEFGDGIQDIGKKIDKFKTRMTRMLGTVMIFNLVRKGLTSIRNSFVSLLKENDGFNNSLNQIKANLMTAFAPIYNACLPAINSLMSALSKLTGTIAVFISGLFGKSLKDSQKEAKKLSKSLDKVSSSGEEASGSLASFDKLEVINDSSSSGGGSSGSGVNYDGEIQYSQKLLDILNRIKDFIVDNKELVIGAIAGITGALIALKVFGLDPITGIGIGLIIMGVVKLIQDVIKFINDPSWDNFANILIDIGIILLGLAIIFGGWPLIVAAAIALIVGIIIKYWDEISAFLGKIGSWIYDNVIKPVADFFKGLWDGIVNGFNTAVNWIKTTFNNVVNFFKNIISTIINLFVKIGTTVGNVIGGAFRGIINGVLSAIENILNFPIKSINKLIGVINAIPGINLGKLSTFNLPRLASGTVIPPRHEFAAILGDQKHGTNIEAPLDTIKQANREVLEEFMNRFGGLNSGEKEIVLKNLSFIFQMGNTDFRKFIVDQVRLREKDLGKPLFVS